MTIKVEIRDCILDVEVIEILVHPPQWNAGNSEDFYGYTTIEYFVTSGLVYNYSTEMDEELSMQELEDVVETNDAEIKEAILKYRLETAQDED